MPKPKVLIIDDEPAILRIVQDSLSERFRVIGAPGAQEALAFLLDDKPNLILVDNIMPGMSGIEFIKTLRLAKGAAQIPIIMLTALKESGDRIEAFKAGVDDFISKPFHPDELLARVESRLSRFGALTAGAASSASTGNFSINPEMREVRIDGQVIHLTQIETTILQKLIDRQGSIVSRSSLEAAIWAKPNPEERLLDIHMVTLRKKIRASDRIIETVYGKGYVLRGKAA